MRQGTSIYSGKHKHEKTRVPPNSFWEGNSLTHVVGAIGGGGRHGQLVEIEVENVAVYGSLSLIRSWPTLWRAPSNKP